MSNTPVILGSVFGTIIPITFWVGLIVCCVVLCCLCYKRCGKRRSRSQSVTATTVVYALPQQHRPPPGYQPSFPGYQPVPVLPGYMGPLNTATPPPSYSEATDPSLNPVAFSPPAHLMQASQPYPPPPHSDELAQAPQYNPAYGPVK